MCLGPEAALYTALATGAAGTLVNAAASRKIDKNREAAVLAENQRQANIGRQNQAVLDAQTEKLGAQPQQAQALQATQAREAAIQPPPIQPEVYSQATPAAPTEVKSELASRLVDAIRRGRGQITGMAALQGQGDANLTNQFGLTRSLTEASKLRGFSEGSSNILPLELEGANRSARGQQLAGDILGGISGLSGLYAITQPKVKTPVPIESRTLRDRSVASAYRPSAFSY